MAGEICKLVGSCGVRRKCKSAIGLQLCKGWCINVLPILLFFFMKGTIKKIVRDKGFGFVVPENGQKDLFFHVNDMQPGVDFDSLQEGQMLEFDIADSQKGPKAANVRLVEGGDDMGMAA